MARKPIKGGLGSAEALRALRARRARVEAEVRANRVRAVAEFIRTRNSWGRLESRPSLVSVLGARRADAFLNRTFAPREAMSRRIKIGVAIGVATAVGSVLLASRARADSPGARSGSAGPGIDATAAVAVGATAAVGYGLYRRGGNITATLSARPAMTPAIARPAGMPALPTSGPWSPRAVMPPLMGSAVTGIPRIGIPALARPVAAPAAARPAGPLHKISRGIAGLAILNGASAGYDRGGISGALSGALSGATFGLSDIALGMLPSRPATAGSDAGARSLAAARAASRDAGTAVASAGSNPAARVVAATRPAGDGMTDAYARTRNGRLENVAGYTTPSRA